MNELLKRSQKALLKREKQRMKKEDEWNQFKKDAPRQLFQKLIVENEISEYFEGWPDGSWTIKDTKIKMTWHSSEYEWFINKVFGHSFLGNFLLTKGNKSKKLTDNCKLSTILESIGDLHYD